MGVRFFFEQTQQNIDARYPNLKGGTTNVRAARAGRVLKPYGLLNQLYSLAKDGVFTFGGHSPIESVKKTNLYKVLTYLSHKQALADYEEIYREDLK